MSGNVSPSSPDFAALGSTAKLGCVRPAGDSNKVEQYVTMFTLDGHGGIYVLQFGNLYEETIGTTWQQTEQSRVRGTVGNAHSLDGNVVEIAPDSHGGLYVLFSGNDLWDITYANGVRASQTKVTSDSVQDFYFDDQGNLHWDGTPGFWQKVGDFFANLGKDLFALELTTFGEGWMPVGGGSLGQKILGDQYWSDAGSGAIILGAAAVTYLTGGALSDITGPIIAGAIGGAAGAATSETADTLLYHTPFEWQSIVLGAAEGAAMSWLRGLLFGSATTNSAPGTLAQSDGPIGLPQNNSALVFCQSSIDG